MHVAVPSLLTFATWRRSRPLSIALGAFTVVILCSSVALGWHYAVDGYASVAGAGLIWLLVARLPLRAALGEPNARGS
jgi:membrane-associated phospholipid phosphatase